MNKILEIHNGVALVKSDDQGEVKTNLAFVCSTARIGDNVYPTSIVPFEDVDRYRAVYELFYAPQRQSNQPSGTYDANAGKPLRGGYYKEKR